MASVTAAQRIRPFMGRETELRALSDLVQGNDTRVACLHGIAGVGKSGLVRVFLDRTHREGSSVLLLDCRTVEPTERGFLAAAGGFDDVDAFVRALSPPVVIALDHYEVFRLMDTWLRQVLVPALPAGAVEEHAHEARLADARDAVQASDPRLVALHQVRQGAKLRLAPYERPDPLGSGHRRHRTSMDLFRGPIQ